MRRRFPADIAVLAGAALVWLAFAVAAGPAFRTWGATSAILTAAAPLAILAIAVALLMIGGEFDLSVGSTLGACSMSIMVLTQHAHLPLPAALALSLLLAIAIGWGNGLLVTRTGLPSFIVTLGTLFMVRGFTIALTRLLTRRTQIGGLAGDDSFEIIRAIFGSAIVWTILLTVCAAWVLQRTPWGNWILGAGGNADAADRAGVPVNRVKIALFVTTAVSAWLVAVLQVVQYTGADVLRGEGQEFRAIVAAVIGGTLLTGGYGSVMGAAIGALIFGMVQQGIVITGIDADWFQVFLGGMLIVAVIANNFVRRRMVAG